MCGFPMTYITLPFSCCVRNPSARVLNPTRDKDNITMVENVVVGCAGAVTIFMCCGCCCGCCGSVDVDENPQT